MARLKSSFYAFAAALLMSAVGPCARAAHAGAPLDGSPFTSAAQAVAIPNSLAVWDVTAYSRLAAQVTYGDGTPSSFTVVDGGKSAGILTILSTVSLSGQSISIAGQTFTFGVDISTIPSATLTGVIIATRTAAVLAANATVGGLFTISTNVASGFSTVSATRTVVGAGEYSLTASAPSKTVWSHPYTQGGSDPAITIADDSITRTSHGFTTGLRVLVATPTTGTIPTGLTGGTTYFAIKLNENQFALATTSTTALAGTKVDITRLTGSGVIGFAPLALSGTASFKWQASLDGTNFADLSVSSVTYSAAGTTLWDFALNNYKYLKLNFVAPTSGGISLAVRLAGRRE